MSVSKFCVSLHSQSATGALVQLVRIRACHARGQGFESPTHRQSNRFFRLLFLCFGDSSAGGGSADLLAQIAPSEFLESQTIIRERRVITSKLIFLRPLVFLCSLRSPNKLSQSAWSALTCSGRSSPESQSEGLKFFVLRGLVSRWRLGKAWPFVLIGFQGLLRNTKVGFANQWSNKLAPRLAKPTSPSEFPKTNSPRPFCAHLQRPFESEGRKLMVACR